MQIRKSALLPQQRLPNGRSLTSRVQSSFRRFCRFLENNVSISGFLILTIALQNMLHAKRPRIQWPLFMLHRSELHTGFCELKKKWLQEHKSVQLACATLSNNFKPFSMVPVRIPYPIWSIQPLLLSDYILLLLRNSPWCELSVVSLSSCLINEFRVCISVEHFFNGSDCRFFCFWLWMSIFLFRHSTN